ncbi:MAG: hypothetical protein ACPHO9_06475, partial [Ilumatobacteraceae bacterium]
ERIAEALTMSGLEVEQTVPAGEGVAFQTEVTSNRPDLLSMLGVARELSALCGEPVVEPRRRYRCAA